MPELQNLVPPGAIAVHMGVSSRRGVLSHLAELMARGHGLPAEDVATALIAREAQGSTAFGGGVAIPHGRLAGAESVHGAILRLHAPLEWEAPDGQPVDVVACLVGPDGTEMLKALALVSRALRDPLFVAKLRGAANADSLWSLLTLQEAA